VKTQLAILIFPYQKIIMIYKCLLKNLNNSFNSTINSQKLNTLEKKFQSNMDLITAIQSNVFKDTVGLFDDAQKNTAIEYYKYLQGINELHPYIDSKTLDMVSKVAALITRMQYVQKNESM
jgi:hypothetical protein